MKQTTVTLNVNVSKARRRALLRPRAPERALQRAEDAIGKVVGEHRRPHDQPLQRPRVGQLVRAVRALGVAAAAPAAAAAAQRAAAPPVESGADPL